MVVGTYLCMNSRTSSNQKYVGRDYFFSTIVKISTLLQLHANNLFEIISLTQFIAFDFFH